MQFKIVVFVENGIRPDCGNGTVFKLLYHLKVHLISYHVRQKLEPEVIEFQKM